MKKLLVVLFTAQFCFHAFAQQRELDEFHNLMLRTRNDNDFRKIEIQGSPYTDKEMVPGTIVFISGAIVDSVPLRYNWYSKEMEVTYKNELHSVPASRDIDYVQIGNNRYVPFYNLKEIKGYLVQLHKGSYNLFRAEDIRFIEAKPAQSGYEEAQPAKYESFGHLYYAISSDGRIVELEIKNKKLPLQFPDKKDEITSLINNNGLNVKKEPDLIKLFQLLDNAVQP
jgi:hypothetical protein